MATRSDFISKRADNTFPDVIISYRVVSSAQNYWHFICCIFSRLFSCVAQNEVGHKARMWKPRVSLCFAGPLTKEIESEITRSPASNTRRPADKNLGPMLPITKEILRDFYTPFNEKLAKVLRNDSFLWENDSKLWTAHHKADTDTLTASLFVWVDFSQVPKKINVFVFKLFFKL